MESKARDLSPASQVCNGRAMMLKVFMVDYGVKPAEISNRITKEEISKVLEQVKKLLTIEKYLLAC